MKKLLSALLSLVLCASVAVTNPPVHIGEDIFNPPKEEQYEGTIDPCSDSEDPGHVGESST
jgi:hypothetical protein